MTQKEFQDMTDFQLDGEQYQCIEEIYMMVDEDKQYFCELLKAMYKADRCTIEFMLQLGRKLLEKSWINESRIKELKEEIDSLQNFIYEQSEDPDEREIKDKCKEIYGEARFYAKYIEDDKELSGSDLNAIADILNRTEE